jgi:hypothetical protein
MSQEPLPISPPTEKAEPLIRGAAKIAEYVFGDTRYRRRIYHLCETNKHFPIVRIGSTLCMRKSAYENFLQSQEGKNLIDKSRS